MIMIKRYGNLTSFLPDFGLVTERKKIQINVKNKFKSNILSMIQRCQG